MVAGKKGLADDYKAALRMFLRRVKSLRLAVCYYGRTLLKVTPRENFPGWEGYLWLLKLWVTFTGGPVMFQMSFKGPRAKRSRSIASCLKGTKQRIAVKRATWFQPWLRWWSKKPTIWPGRCARWRPSACAARISWCDPRPPRRGFSSSLPGFLAPESGL